jgi:hypothetical protein
VIVSLLLSFLTDCQVNSMQTHLLKWFFKKFTYFTQLVRLERLYPRELGRVLFGFKGGRNLKQNRRPQDNKGDSGAPKAMNIEEARHLVTIVYRMLLNRDPDENGLAHHSNLLHHGVLQQYEFFEAILQSEEFGSCASKLPSVARYLARTIIAIATGRRSDDLSIESYAKELQNGYSLAEFLREVFESTEFAAKMERRESIVKSEANELGELAAELILARLSAEGYKLAVPPPSTTTSSPISKLQLASLIRTLNLLVDSGPSHLSFHTRPHNERVANSLRQK